MRYEIQTIYFRIQQETSHDNRNTKRKPTRKQGIQSSNPPNTERTPKVKFPEEELSMLSMESAKVHNYDLKKFTEQMRERGKT